jgi:hypothetical protein
MGSACPTVYSIIFMGSACLTSCSSPHDRFQELSQQNVEIIAIKYYTSTDIHLNNNWHGSKVLSSPDWKCVSLDVMANLTENNRLITTSKRNSKSSMESGSKLDLRCISLWNIIVWVQPDYYNQFLKLLYRVVKNLYVVIILGQSTDVFSLIHPSASVKSWNII